MSGMDRLTIDDLEYWAEYGDYDVKLMARELIAHRRAPQAAPAPSETCTRCMGNGEIVTDWDAYLHPPKDATEEAVADCPDCDGTGHVVSAPAPSDGLREAEPNYCFNPEDWEYTQSWDARDELAESILDYARNEGPIRVSTLISGPDKWVARISLDTDGDGEADDWEYQWFDSEEAARAALSTPTEERK